MKELPKAYEPKNYEDKIYKKWEESGLFNPDVCVKQGVVKKKADYFSIVLPPPNVTGTLHMGHAVMLAVQDVMVRYHRMKGDRALWVPGTDHAAIATQAKVEKLLMEKERKTKYDLGRDEFLKRVEAFAKESHDIIVNQCRKMGASLDWSREAYTLDEKRNLAVRTVFKKMYDDGLIYRGYRIVNWCPHCHSTIADDEVEYKEQKAKLYKFKYSPEFPFAIATTRPETKLGDTAVAVNPKDKRYKKYIGKTLEVKKFAGGPDLKLKIIASDEVDMEFGTGALGVTPAHSYVDYEIAQKNNLEMIKVIDEDGRMTEEAGKEYVGLSVLEARDKVVRSLIEDGSIDKNETMPSFQNNLSVCYRCGTAIEPLPSKQWFIDVNKSIKIRGKKSLKQLMQKAVGNKKGQIEIIPDRFNKTYFHWIDNLRDWCISRQIWYGHQIPVWYKGDEVYVDVNPPKGEGWQQDPDTLDTWFSSGLWTFSTLGYPDLKAEDLKNYHPTSVMETGYDILFFWVARMILMTTYVLGDIPFKTVYLHGLVRDEQGRKMSKSLGNVIDPLDMIAKYGTDATRLSLLVGNTPGNDMKLSEEKIAGFRNFTNKLWNISRFMLINISEPKINVKRPKPKTLADEWVLESLEIVKSLVEGDFAKYNFAIAGEMLREFTWNNLADWYLEIAKVEGGKSEILNYILNTILKLWHPFMPYVTEAIWTEIYGKDKILMVEKWPSSVYGLGSFGDERSVDFLIIKEIIEKIRSLRAEYKIEPAKKIGAKINIGKKEKMVKNNEQVIKALARLETIEFVKSGAEVSLDLASAVDVEKEKPRLEKEIAELKKYTAGLENKLSNKEFVKNAPKEVVEKDQEKLSEAKSKLKKLEEQLKNLL